MKPRGLHVSGSLLVILAAIAFVLALLVSHFAARANAVQDWIHRYHPMCCNHEDCIPVHVRRTVGGLWMVHWYGREVPYVGPVRQSPAETWACGTPDVVRCLFIAGGTA